MAKKSNPAVSNQSGVANESTVPKNDYIIAGTDKDGVKKLKADLNVNDPSFKSRIDRIEQAHPENPIGALTYIISTLRPAIKYNKKNTALQPALDYTINKRNRRMMNVYDNWQIKLTKLPFNQDLSEAEVDEFIRVELVGLALFKQKWVKDCLAITAYHARAQSDLPIVRTLICDDAGSFHRITEEVGLCWIHDGRMYKKLEPRLGYNRQLLEDFREKYWEFYHELLAYRDNPDPREAVQLGSAFDKLFKTQTGYKDLDERITITMGKRPQLLLALKHPELPLHNNPAELGVRQRVRKRVISLQPRSVSGLRAWDTFQSLAATCQKLGSSFHQYVRDRICQVVGQPSLS